MTHLPENLDIYGLKNDAMGMMYDYQSAVKPDSNVIIHWVTFREVAAITLLYRCLENATGVASSDLNETLLDELDDYEGKYPRIVKKSRELLDELLEPYLEDESNEENNDEPQGEIAIGTRIRLTEGVLANYGRKWRDKVFPITDISDHYVPAAEFFDPTSPRYQESGGHPGYDTGVSGVLVEAEGFPYSLYRWEFEIVEDDEFDDE